MPTTKRKIVLICIAFSWIPLFAVAWFIGWNIGKLHEPARLITQISVIVGYILFAAVFTFYLRRRKKKAVQAK